MRAACLQLFIEPCSREENTRRALEMASFALHEEAQILVYPELFLTGFCYQPSSWEAQPFPSLDPFRMLARERGCTILGSIMSEGQNMGFCIDANGMQFRPKVHPFGPEKKHFVGGDFIAPIPTRLGKIGLQICYDLRFPEVARALTLKGADLLVTIAQFPAERKDHWRTLCIARAIENQIHHLACNCAGQGFAGGSMIVDPWGRVLKEAGPNQELILEEIDIADRDRIRQKLPCLDDRRPELY